MPSPLQGEGQVSLTKPSHPFVASMASRRCGSRWAYASRLGILRRRFFYPHSGSIQRARGALAAALHIRVEIVQHKKLGDTEVGRLLARVAERRNYTLHPLNPGLR